MTEPRNRADAKAMAEDKMRKKLEALRKKVQRRVLTEKVAKRMRSCLKAAHEAAMWLIDQKFPHG